MFRVLRIAKGQTKDEDGRGVGHDHVVLVVDPPDDGDEVLMITTDHVRVSEYADVVPGTQLALARLIAQLLREGVADRPRWRLLLARALQTHLPPASAWVQVDDHRWAVEGSFLVRGDHPVPEGTPCGLWNEGLSASNLQRYLSAVPDEVLMRRGEVRLDNNTADIYQRPDGSVVALGERPAPVLRGLHVRYATRLNALFGYRDAELVAVAMPLCLDEMSSAARDRLRGLLEGRAPEVAQRTSAEIETARSGVLYVLRRIQTDPNLGYYAGACTESLHQLCRALAALTGEDEGRLQVHYGRQEDWQGRAPDVLRLRSRVEQLEGELVELRRKLEALGG